LGKHFTFDERTPLRDDSSAQERLRCIGDFLKNLHELPKGGMRLLVLEDFFITPLKSWICNGEAMNTEAIEQYLLQCIPASTPAAARVVHTYDEWKTPRGLLVQAGVGLTMEHFTKAMDFLNGDSSALPATPSPNSPEFESMPMKQGNVDISISNKIVAKKPAKEASILSDPQAQKRWLECLSSSLPWLSITSVWSF